MRELKNILNFMTILILFFNFKISAKSRWDPHLLFTKVNLKTPFWISSDFKFLNIIELSATNDFIRFTK